MKIHRQIEIKQPLYIAKLDSGVIINVYDGYALGSDGRTYYHVGKEDENGILQTVGWCCDTDKPMIVE